MSKAATPGILLKLNPSLFDESLRICIHNLEGEWLYVFCDIAYLEACGNNTLLVFMDRKDAVISTLNIREYEKRYSAWGLVRVSKSIIINPALVEGVGTGKTPYIYLKGYPKAKIILGISYRSRFYAAFSKVWTCIEGLIAFAN